MGAAHVRGFLTEGVKVAAADLSWDVVEAFRAEVEAADGLPLVMDKMSCITKLTADHPASPPGEPRRYGAACQ